MNISHIDHCKHDYVDAVTFRANKTAAVPWNYWKFHYSWCHRKYWQLTTPRIVRVADVIIFYWQENSQNSTENNTYVTHVNFRSRQDPGKNVTSYCQNLRACNVRLTCCCTRQASHEENVSQICKVLRNISERKREKTLRRDLSAVQSRCILLRIDTA